jgi:acetylornithine deacetylase
VTQTALTEERVRSTLVELLSFESPQASLERVRAFIRNVVRPRLPDGLFDQVQFDDQGNLLARRLGPAGSKPLLVYGYGATYPAAGMPDAYPARVVVAGDEVRVRGRGACEQRAALAAALGGVLAFLGSQPRLQRGIDLVVNVAGEMGNHLVAEELVGSFALEPACGVIASASNNQLCLGNLGRVDVHVAVYGRSCHSSDPSNGVNALDGARTFLNRLADTRLERADPELGQATLAATFLETEPRASHTIPGRANVTLDRRLLPGEEIAEAMAEVERCARDLGACRAEVRAGHFNYPNKVSPRAEVARQMRAAMEWAGLAPAVVYKRSALDAGYFTRRGAECIVFGPGDPRLGHSDDEWVALRDVVGAAQVYQRFCQLMCAASE